MNHVVAEPQRGDDGVGVALGFLGKNIDSRTAEVPGFERCDQRINVDDVAAGGIDEAGARFHLGECLGAD